MDFEPDSGPEGPLLFFDGDCGLCARSVRFVLDHERDRALRFAPLQSSTGRAAAARAGLDPDRLTTLVFLGADGLLLTKSDAALRVARHLRQPWRLVRAGLIVPRFLRDAAYDFVARRRHRWFGTGDACRLFTPDEAARLVDDPSAG